MRAEPAGSREGTTRIGYFVPEFPGQTHIFFWREMNELKKLGVSPVLISTKRPNQNLVSHAWAPAAISETKYLFPLGAAEVIWSVLGLLGTGLARQRRILRLIFREAAPGTRFRLVLLLPFAMSLVRFCRQQGLTHVHVHSCGNAAAVAMLAHEIAGLGYSLTLHGPLVDYGPNQKLKWREADFGVVITRRLHDEVRDRLGEDAANKAYIAAMGVDTGFFSRQEAYAPWDGSSRIRLFSCGRLNYTKGHQDLIEAVGILAKQRGLDVHLSIAGEDESGGHGFRSTLQEQISRTGLDDHVSLLGAVSEERVREHLGNSHIFVLASHHEPLGVAYMEAMAMSLPVVGTKGGGVGELIDDGVDGLLVAPKTPGELAGKIDYLLQHPAEAVAMGVKARDKVVAHFQASGSALVMKQGCLAAAAG